jgi:hypothetical protein
MEKPNPGSDEAIKNGCVCPCTIQRRTMEKKPKCRICDDTGFFKGAICVCITGKGKTDFGDIFGDLFGRTMDNLNKKEEN